MSSRCKSCDATIIWAITDHGKSMPIDAQPSANGNVELRLDHGGAYRAKVHAGPNGHTGQLHTSHFVTCPNAAKHRRGQR